MLPEFEKRYPEALLWQVQLDGSGGLADRTASDNNVAVGNGLLWVHLRSDADGALEIMRALGLADDIIESLIANETRPRTVLTDRGTMMYLRGINRNPNADPDDMVSLRLWLTPDLVVTVRKKDRKLLSVMDVKSSLDRGAGPVDVGSLVCALVERIADRINETVDDIDETLLQLEHQINGESHQISRQELALVRRQSAAIRRYLAPQRDALEALNRNKSLLSDGQAFELREQTDRMTRYVEDLDLARERAVVLQEELRSQIAEIQGQRMYLLSMVTAIFLPLSFLTGVFGMNVAGLPGLEEPTAFLLLAGGMGVIALLSLAVMKWRRWL